MPMSSSRTRLRLFLFTWFAIVTTGVLYLHSLRIQSRLPF